MRVFDVEELITTVVPSGAVRDYPQARKCPEKDQVSNLTDCPSGGSIICMGPDTKRQCEVPNTFKSPPATPKPGTPPEGELAVLRRRLRAAQRG